MTDLRAAAMIAVIALVTAALRFLPFFIFGSFRPLARETANASMASPTPSMMLVKKKLKSIGIFISSNFKRR